MKYENTSLNQKALDIISNALAEMAPKRNERNPDILRMKDGQSLRLRFVVTDKNGDPDPEFNMEFTDEFTPDRNKPEEKTLSQKRAFRVYNDSEGGKSQLFPLSKKHARVILAAMGEYHTSELTIKRVGSGKDDTTYLPMPLMPERVA